MRRQKDVMILPGPVHILLVIICQQILNSKRSRYLASANGKQNHPIPSGEYPGRFSMNFSCISALTYPFKLFRSQVLLSIAKASDNLSVV